MRLIGRFGSEFEEGLFDLLPIDALPEAAKVRVLAPNAVVKEVSPFGDGEVQEGVEMVEPLGGVSVLACDGPVEWQIGRGVSDGMGRGGGACK